MLLELYEVAQRISYDNLQILVTRSRCSPMALSKRAIPLELFGFDRTRTIASLPAEDIARAALQYGQEDDITVLTVKMASAAMGG